MKTARWHFGIGDPNAIGWVTVGAYAIAAAVSIRAFLTARAGQHQLANVDAREANNQKLLARLWLMIAIAMMVLAVNKQLDLQTWLLQTLRERAVAGGWYDDRRRYQAEFIVVVAMLGVVTTAALGWLLRSVLRRVLLVVAALAMLMLFVVIRAASFHYVDKVLALGGDVRLSRIVELAGIGLMVTSAVHWLSSERHVMRATLAGKPGSADAPTDASAKHLSPARPNTTANPTAGP